MAIAYLASLLLLASPAEKPPEAPEAAPRLLKTPQSQMPRTGQETLSFRVPVYPRAKTPPVRVGDELYAHGMPMFVQSFYTDDDPHQVLNWYKEFFDSWGLAMMGDGDFSDEFKNPSITVFDDVNGVDLHVICVPGDQNGKTMVMLAMADIATFEQNLDKAVKQKWGGLPPYPEVDDPAAMSSTDGEVHTATVTFTTRDAPDKVLEFYKKAFASGRFRQLTQDQGPGELVFVDGRGTWRVAARPGAAPGFTGVFAVWSDRLPEAP